MSYKKTDVEVIHGEVGDWSFIEREDGTVTHIVLRLPSFNDPDGGIAVLPVEPGTPQVRWDWNGNRESPTLTPSILHHGNPEWHGYLTDGKLVPA